MRHLPKQALFLGRALRAQFDCTQQPLPNHMSVLLCLLDGSDRRHRLQATLGTRQTVKLDLPADLHWKPADQVPEWITRADGNLTIEQIEQHQ
jgi:hypothetical protein